MGFLEIFRFVYVDPAVAEKRAAGRRPFFCLPAASTRLIDVTGKLLGLQGLLKSNFFAFIASYEVTKQSRNVL